LSALGNCINALTKSKRGHVPYRDSKLTHILRESLGGNTKTTLLITCSPHIFNVEETISTLKFGQRAKTIKNSVSVNKQRSVEELNAIIIKLNKELAVLKEYVTILENELKGVKGPDWDIGTLRRKVNCYFFFLIICDNFWYEIKLQFFFKVLSKFSSNFVDDKRDTSNSNGNKISKS
jgi:hypothetical protein